MVSAIGNDGPLYGYVPDGEERPLGGLRCVCVEATDAGGQDETLALKERTSRMFRSCPFE